MKSLNEIGVERDSMATMNELTRVFEGIASMRINQIKNQVVEAQQFFNELWQIYSQIRVVDYFNFGRSQNQADIIDKELYIVITAEGGFSGDIDQKLITAMLQSYDKDKNEIIVIGHHGAAQLDQRGISFKKQFKLPEKDKDINVMPIIQEVQQYRTASVYYQNYVSLMVQDIKKISLSSAVSERGDSVQQSEDIISEATYIFEPGTYAVVDHLESTMMQITLSQVLLDSKLAQYASRFRAMTAAHDRADEAANDLRLSYNRTKRRIKDERLKELVNGLRKAGVQQ